MRRNCHMNKYKKLAVNTIIFAIGSFGSKIFSLLLNNLYTKHIAPTDFYSKSLVEMLVLFLLPVFSFSITDAIIRYGIDSKYKKEEVFTTACFINLVGMVIMFFVMPFLKYVPVFKQVSQYALLLGIYIFTSSLRSLCSQFTRAKGQVKLFAVDGIVTTFLLFIFNVLFISMMGLGVKGFMISTILSDLCSALFLFFMAKLYKYFSLKKLNKCLGKDMLRFSIPLIPTTIMWTFTGFSDQLFIGNIESNEVFVGQEAAGIYGAATKVPNLLSMVATIFFQAWNMSAIMEYESEDRNEFFGKVYSAYEAVLFSSCAVLILLVKPISAILINYKTFPEYSTAYIYTPMLITASVFTCLNLFLFSVYTSTKHSKNAFWTIMIACVANIILNMYFIPIWGIHGATIATFLSYFICYWVRVVDTRKYIAFDFNVFKNILNTIIVILMCLFTVRKEDFVIILVLALMVFVINIKALILTIKKFINKTTPSN